MSLKNGDFGPVIVMYSGAYGDICATNYDDTDAMVLCREAGFLTGFAYRMDGTE